MAGHGAAEEGSNASCGKPITLYRFYNQIMAAGSRAIRHFLWILGHRTSSRGTLYRFYNEIFAAASTTFRHIVRSLQLKCSSQGLGQSTTVPPHCSSTIRKVADWSLLPSHLLITMAEELLVADIIRLPAVCKTWAWSLGLPFKGWPNPPRYRASFVPIPPSVPWMLLPNEYSEQANFFSFRKLSDNQIQTISPIPEMVGRRCVGASPDGWLVTLDPELNPRVFNPLTREELPLPSLSSLLSNRQKVAFIHDDPDDYLMEFLATPADAGARRYLPRECVRDAYFLKIVLTSAPPLGVATVFFGIESLQTQLAFARVGDASWTLVQLSEDPSEYIEDVMYHKEDGRLYAVDWSGCLMFFDLHDCDWSGGLWKSPKPLPVNPTFIANIKDGYFGINWRSHLVFLSGRFLRISRNINAYTNLEAQMLRLGLPLEAEAEAEDADEDEGEDEDEDEGESESEDEEEHSDEGEVFEPRVMSKTSEIRITKLNHMVKEPGMKSSWIPASASDLEDQAVFIGCNHVFTVPAAGRPGLKKNSIYFTETYRYESLDCRAHLRDAAVFDTETGVFQRFFLPNSRYSWDNWPPPLWFMPSHLRFEMLS